MEFNSKFPYLDIEGFQNGGIRGVMQFAMNYLAKSKYQNRKHVCKPNSDKPNKSARSDMSDPFVHVINLANLRVTAVTNTQSQVIFIISGLICSKDINKLELVHGGPTMPWDDLHHKWVIPIGFMTINMETVSG